MFVITIIKLLPKRNMVGICWLQAAAFFQQFGSVFGWRILSFGE
jgi:hypothetical protein